MSLTVFGYYGWRSRCKLAALEVHTGVLKDPWAIALHGNLTFFDMELPAARCSLSLIFLEAAEGFVERYTLFADSELFNFTYSFGRSTFGLKCMEYSICGIFCFGFHLTSCPVLHHYSIHPKFVDMQSFTCIVYVSCN